MSDPAVEAMEAGAGLPVLEPLDRLLERRSLEDPDAGEAEAARELLDAVDAWLDRLEDRIDERLDGAHRGPLADAIPRRRDRRLALAREDVEALRARLDDGRVPWDAVVDLLEDLHGLRDEAAHLARAAGHLAEVAQLVEDVPDDEAGQAALDELGQREARAAAREDPQAWARAARDLEERALDAVRVDPTTSGHRDPTDGHDEPTPDPTPEEPAPTDAEPTPDLDPEPEPEPAEASIDRPDPSPSPQGNGADREADEGGTVLVRDPARRNGSTPEPATRDHEDEATEPWEAPRAPETRRQSVEGDPAGPGVLEDWEAAELDDELRHAPFWAPIARGEVVPREGTAEQALERAAAVEVDLVEVELPRALAVPTGSNPAAVRRRIAQRAAEVTRREPERPAREAFLDYVRGKLPSRYRETGWGLALVASIAHAVCTDDAWREAGPGYEGTLERMVEAELERTPAVDLAELADGLVGSSSSGREAVHEAAKRLAEEHDDVRLHEDGVVVRALAAREDPDALYELKESLARRLGEDRAEALVTALVTTDDDPSEDTT